VSGSLPETRLNPNGRYHPEFYSVVFAGVSVECDALSGEILVNMFFYLVVFTMVCLLITVMGGHYLNLLFGDKKTLSIPLFSQIESFLHRLIGISNVSEMHWKEYSKALLVTNFLFGLLGLIILLLQDKLPLNPLQFSAMEPLQAFNTTVSFITNTNWQSYSGEMTLTNLSQMTMIAVSMMVGATSGLVVCLAFLRGLTHRPMGNFYQDFIRAIVYIMLPVSLLTSIFFVSQGVPQTLEQQVLVNTVEGQQQKIALGPVASLLSIKQFGTNGGGFFNANSAHPFENPNGITNFVEILLELALPMSLVYLSGLWLNDRKQGWLIWASMFLMFMTLLGTLVYFEGQGNPNIAALNTVQMSPQFGNLEGKETRFGLLESTLFINTTTATSTGAVNTMHDSLTPLAGGVPLFNMMLNIIFGGVGVGLMGYLLYGLIAVFITGLMVGRTPEIFGKKIEKGEMILASLAILLHPALILIPTAISICNDFGLSSLNNLGPHGLTEILYAYTSAAANNGSAFAGLNANTPWYNVSIGIVILLGRYISIIMLLATAGSLLKKPLIEASAGSLKTNTLLFSGVWIGIILIVSALTFLPVLMLGPIAEALNVTEGKLY
jgi:potassium-transporting ATPase potassium-binding subunit